MRKGYKAVVFLGLILIALIMFANWTSVLVIFQYIYASNTYLIIIGLIIILGLAYLFGPWAELGFKLRMSRRFGEKRIPQDKRIAIGREWLEEHWESETAGKGVVLVDNYITPHRDDARPIEMMLFTTMKVYSDQRIDVKDIPESKRFYVFVDCINGECFSMSYMNSLLTEEAAKFITRWWFMGIKERVETPTDKWMKEAMAKATGEEIAKRELKEEVKA